MISLFCFYIQVTGSQTKRNTWKKAVLDCYENDSSLESNETILKKYLNSHTGVNSIWVGGFEALLPWIEIRGKIYSHFIELFCITLIFKYAVFKELFRSMTDSN